ncbi:M48 family metallopeptidase [Terrimonas sp. NA20]|uniref:M48 family metallopeptidase n=1 Tax=Terrimonas ginsenosidimutans TaxID=2908004 RepID=A0ABS9KYG6_9BACT|nr:M48 family metallopeptidase [Terrimonas ginsenosidimutans]MCG2617374.1 M48 family metallopeptidase [Terrimonas ginsenosidimutans]
MHSQITRNNRYSILLLLAFPALLLALCYAIILYSTNAEIESANISFMEILPYVLMVTGSWFLIAWLGHSTMIRLATGAKSLDRATNKRVYNLLENLCISVGMKMPKLYIIPDDSLNAFASGISERSYSISLSSGIIEKLNDEELEGVIAHELSHIRNRDVRLLIVSIIFVGIFSFLAELAFRGLRFTGRKSDKDSKGGGAIILFAIVITAIAYLISILLRFGISRKREYLADAGAADLTKKPYALASALRKISGDPLIEAVESRDVAQLFIDNPKPSIHKSACWDNLFATHPPIEKRIALLSQY